MTVTVGERDTVSVVLTVPLVECDPDGVTVQLSEPVGEADCDCVTVPLSLQVSVRAPLADAVHDTEGEVDGVQEPLPVPQGVAVGLSDVDTVGEKLSVPVPEREVECVGDVVGAPIVAVAV